MNSSAIAVAPPTRRNVAPSEWLIGFSIMVALIAGLNLFVAWRLDVFGVLRSARGRSLVTSHHERKEKYLLNQAYVPENFNALIIGVSASTNWRLGNVDGDRFYNESLDGGDATEERKIVEQALRRGHFGAAVVVLYPAITDQHVLRESLSHVKQSEALGSLDLLGVEYEMAADHVMHRSPASFPDGRHLLPIHGQPGPDESFPAWPIDFGSDVQSREDYRALAQELVDQGAEVIYVSYPLYERALQPNEAAWAHYLASMRQWMPSGTVIDFDGPQYLEFRSDPSNYIDDVHLSPSGAQKFSKVLRAKLATVLAHR